MQIENSPRMGPYKMKFPQSDLYKPTNKHCCGRADFHRCKFPFGYSTINAIQWGRA